MRAVVVCAVAVPPRLAQGLHSGAGAFAVPFRRSNNIDSIAFAGLATLNSIAFFHYCKLISLFIVD